MALSRRARSNQHLTDRKLIQTPSAEPENKFVVINFSPGSTKHLVRGIHYRASQKVQRTERDALPDLLKTGLACSSTVGPHGTGSRQKSEKCFRVVHGFLTSPLILTPALKRLNFFLDKIIFLKHFYVESLRSSITAEQV